MQQLLPAAVFLVVGATTATATPADGLAGFAGEYGIRNGAAGVVQIKPTLGGSFYEWRVTFERPDHEVRYIVGAPDSSGRCSVWRFEAEPAPAAKHEGTGLFDGAELVTEFPHVNPSETRVFRERWKLLPDGELEFNLEIASSDHGTRRKGGFRASRK